MGGTLTPVGFVFAGAGVATLPLARYGLRNRTKPGATGFAVAVLGIGLWCVTAGVQIAASHYWLALSAANLSVLGASLAVAGWFLLGIEYTDWLSLSRPIWALVAVEPVGTQLLLWTNDWHGLAWTAGTRIDASGILQLSFGPAFWAHAVAVYLLMGVATLLLVSEAIRSSGVRRAQSAALVAGWFPPAIATTVYITGLVDVPYDVTPFGFVLTAFLFAWALFEARFLDIVPIARETATERMNDAFVTIDSEGRIIDCNSAARELVGVDAPVTGMPGTTFFGDYPELLAQFRDETDIDTQISARIEGEQRHFNLDISPIYRNDRLAGRFLVLRDVTELKRREQTLANREEELDVLRQILTRILRHNIRNDLNGVLLRAEILAEELDGDHRDLAEAIVAGTEDIVDTSEKVREIEKIIQQDAPVRVDLVALLDTAVDAVSERYPVAHVTVDIPERCVVEIHPEIETAVENLLENAVEHNDAPEPTVSVTVERAADGVVLTIEDDGPGIPQHELDVIEDERETPLEHGSGLGLWLVDLIRNNAAIDIDFTVTGTGSRVTLRFETDTPIEYADQYGASHV